MKFLGRTKDTLHLIFNKERKCYLFPGYVLAFCLLPLTAHVLTDLIVIISMVIYGSQFMGP